jgi:hypothetical protein
VRQRGPRRALGPPLSRPGGYPYTSSVKGTLFRRESVGSYTSLPKGMFEEALAWLRTWFEEITQGEGQAEAGAGAGATADYSAVTSGYCGRTADSHARSYATR